MKLTIYQKTIATIKILIVVSLLTNCSAQQQNDNYSEDLSVDEKLRWLSQSVNKHLPMNLDSTRTWVSTVALPSQSFGFNYSLKIDTIANPVAEMKKEMYPYLINYCKNNPACKELREWRATLYFNFIHDAGNFLYRIKLTPEEYID